MCGEQISYRINKKALNSKLPCNTAQWTWKVTPYLIFEGKNVILTSFRFSKRLRLTSFDLIDS